MRFSPRGMHKTIAEGIAEHLGAEATIRTAPIAAR
jgi:hypothetical protein